MTLLPCPTCGTRFDAALSAALPFCSDRCRLIDLGRWLNEEYSLPTDPESEELDPPEDGPFPEDDHFPSS